MKVVITDIQFPLGATPIVNGYFTDDTGVPGTHFHGRVEDQDIAVLKAAVAALQDRALEKLTLRETSFRRAQQPGLNITAAETGMVWASVMRIS